MDTIELPELAATLADDAPIRLVMALGPYRHAQAHIPGSEAFDGIEQALAALDPDDDIVVYCTGRYSTASRWAHGVLTARGYQRVRVFAGGLLAWCEAGLPLEGTDAASLGVAA